MRLVYEPGQELSFGLVLIGRAQEFFPHFVVALREMDRIGRGRQVIELARIEESVRHFDAHRLRRSRQHRAWHGLAADLGGLRARAMPARSRHDRFRHADAA
jgi:hypothetical protein